MARPAPGNFIGSLRSDLRSRIDACNLGAIEGARPGAPRRFNTGSLEAFARCAD